MKIKKYLWCVFRCILAVVFLTGCLSSKDMETPEVKKSVLKKKRVIDPGEFKKAADIRQEEELKIWIQEEAARDDRLQKPYLVPVHAVKTEDGLSYRVFTGSVELFIDDLALGEPLVYQLEDKDDTVWFYGHWGERLLGDLSDVFKEESESFYFSVLSLHSSEEGLDKNFIYIEK